MLQEICRDGGVVIEQEDVFRTFGQGARHRFVVGASETKIRRVRDVSEFRKVSREKSARTIGRSVIDQVDFAVAITLRQERAGAGPGIIEPIQFMTMIATFGVACIMNQAATQVSLADLGRNKRAAAGR